MALNGVANKFPQQSHGGGDVLSIPSIKKEVHEELQARFELAQAQLEDLRDGLDGFTPYFEMKKDELVTACETAGVSDTLDGNPSYQELLGVLFVNYFKVD